MQQCKSCQCWSKKNVQLACNSWYNDSLFTAYSVHNEQNKCLIINYRLVMTVTIHIVPTCQLRQRTFLMTVWMKWTKKTSRRMQ